MYANKVNGRSSGGEFLTGNLDFVTVSCTINFLSLASGGDATTQARFEKIVEVISLNGQPVIMGVPYLSGSDYICKMAIEHTGAWATAQAIEDAIVAHQTNGMGFTTSNLTVTISSTI